MPEKILLVDDDKEFRYEFKESFEEYKIIQASNAEEALRLLEKPNEIDLVILDVMMPGLKGTEALKRIKQIVPDLGIIILTGYSSKEIAIEALRGHADNYIEKPIHIEKTKQIIESVLDSKRDGTEKYHDDIKGKIERAKKFVERNSHKKICLKDIADSVYLSPKYFSRIFKQNIGISFNEYRLKAKIEKTYLLLRETSYSINEIADKMGYENTESFIRMFKKITSYTPTEYREKNKIIKERRQQTRRQNINHQSLTNN